MKKIFAFLVVAMTIASVSVWANGAAIKFYDANDNLIFDFKQGAFEFKQNYILDNFSIDFSTALGSLTGAQIIEMGYYKIGNNGKAESIIPINSTNNTLTIHEGETIGFYLTTNGYPKKGQGGAYSWHQENEEEGEGLKNFTFTTTDGAIEGASAFKNNERAHEEADGFTHFSLYINNNDIKQPTFQYALKGHVGGQPLPGLLVTLTLGGMAVAGVTRRKRKASKTTKA